MAKDLAIVLNNGSINSAVAATLAAQKYRPILLFAEGAGASPRARAAYDQQVGHFKPYRDMTVNMAFIDALLSGSAPLPPDPRQKPDLTWRLRRMLPLLAAAASSAMHFTASAIYLGFNVGGEADGLAQATEFFQIYAELLQIPCGMREVDIHSPLLELEPWQVVDLGVQISAPLDKTWSCLEQMPEHCGACRGCRTRQNAFTQAAKMDPLMSVK